VLKESLELLQTFLLQNRNDIQQVNAILAHGQTLWQHSGQFDIKWFGIRREFPSFPIFLNQKLEQHVTRLLDEEALHEHEHGGLAVRIMDIVAYFEPHEDIPETMFDFLKPTVCKEEVSGAVEMLKIHRILGNGRKSCVNIHQVVQKVVHTNIESRSNTQGALEEALQLLLDYMNSSFPKSMLQLTRQLVTSHAKSCWRGVIRNGNDELIRKYAHFPSTACLAQSSIETASNARMAIQLAQEWVPDLDRVLGPTDRNTILLRYREAIAQYQLNNYNQSLKILNILHPLAKGEFGESDKLTVEISNTLAVILSYKRQEKNKILEIHGKNEEINLKNDGPESLTTLLTLHSKGTELTKLGKFDEALELFNRIYKIEKRVMPGNHLMIHSAADWIGFLLVKKGNYQEALELCQSVLVSMTSDLGPEHLITQNCRNRIQYCKARLKISDACRIS